MKFLLSAMLLIAISCSKQQIPLHSMQTPVQDFKLEKYLGTWHVVAKLDHEFERDCKMADLTYSLKKKKSISFFNECFDSNGKKIKDAYADGYQKQNGIGDFDVYLFSIIYLNYRVLYVDENYEYAIIDGGNYEYMWVISKLQKPDQKVISRLVKMAGSFGFDTKKIIYNKLN